MTTVLLLLVAGLMQTDGEAQPPAAVSKAARRPSKHPPSRA